MCGIFGFTFKENTLSQAERALLASHLAILNDNRGGDSWGLCAFHKGKPRIHKGMGKFETAIHRLIGPNTLFGHTRWATHGAKNIKNAHPFEIEEIIGAHNGVISNHTELCAKYDRKFEVDSMHLFAHLAEGRPFQDINGYGAIEYFRKGNPGSIFLAKLQGGSLSIACVYTGIKADKDTEAKNYREIGVVWSSDDTHLKKALNSLAQKFFLYEIEEAQVYVANDGEILTVTDEKLVLGSRWGSSSCVTSGYTSKYSGSRDEYDDRAYQGWLQNNYRSNPNRTLGDGRDYKAKSDGNGGLVVYKGNGDSRVVTGATKEDLELIEAAEDAARQIAAEDGAKVNDASGAVEVPDVGALRLIGKNGDQRAWAAWIMSELQDPSRDKEYDEWLREELASMGIKDPHEVADALEGADSAAFQEAHDNLNNVVPLKFRGDEKELTALLDKVDTKGDPN